MSQLFAYIICCRCCCLSKHKEQKKRKKHKKQTTSTTAKYGTDWETLIQQLPGMTPSQIHDSMITREIKIEQKLYKDKNEFFATALINCGYSLEEPIGKGGFGDVFKIKNMKSGAIQAVKIMKLRENVIANQGGKRRFDTFKREIFSLRKTPHKNIIELIDHFMVNTMWSFMIMEFANGGDLNSRLSDHFQQFRRAFAESDAKRYFVQMANALNFVHSNHLFHGDFKLDNVLITIIDGREVVKVSDFGCSEVAIRGDVPKVAMKGWATGTVIYMSPEQIRVYITVNLNLPQIIEKSIKRYNPLRSDVWALGVCLYKLLFNEYPFSFNNTNKEESLPKMLAKMKEGFDRPEDVVKNVSNKCMNLLEDLLNYHKNARITMDLVMRHQWVRHSPDLDPIV